MEQIRLKSIKVPDGARLICISDIHGELELFKALLEKIDFCGDDILVLLGDLFLKGSQPLPCLHYIMELAKQPNVHVVWGNCDWGHKDYIGASEQAWLDNLPHIIESKDFIFVHAALGPGDLSKQDVGFCTSKYAFAGNAPKFDKWVVVGHWPVNNYCHNIPCQNPIVNSDKRIISIDGGNVISPGGQLNAFMARDGVGEFWWVHADALPTKVVEQAREGSPGSLNITWLDRFVEIIQHGEEFSLVKHIASSKTVEVPTGKIWTDSDGKTCASMATDHFLTVKQGDVVSVVEEFSDRTYAKLNGTTGWIYG